MNLQKTGAKSFHLAFGIANASQYLIQGYERRAGTCWTLACCAVSLAVLNEMGATDFFFHCLFSTPGLIIQVLYLSRFNLH